MVVQIDTRKVAHVGFKGNLPPPNVLNSSTSKMCGNDQCSNRTNLQNWESESVSYNV